MRRPNKQRRGKLRSVVRPLLAGRRQLWPLFCSAAILAATSVDARRESYSPMVQAPLSTNLSSRTAPLPYAVRDLLLQVLVNRVTGQVPHAPWANSTSPVTAFIGS